jgi:hypothetical protein
MAENKKKSSTKGEKLVTKTELGSVTIATEGNKDKVKTEKSSTQKSNNNVNNTNNKIVIYTSIGVIVLVVLFLVLFLIFGNRPSKEKIIELISKNSNATNYTISFDSNVNGLTQILYVKANLAKRDLGNNCFVYKNFETGEEYYVDQTRDFDMSVNSFKYSISKGEITKVLDYFKDDSLVYKFINKEKIDGKVYYNVELKDKESTKSIKIKLDAENGLISKIDHSENKDGKTVEAEDSGKYTILLNSVTDNQVKK